MISLIMPSRSRPAKACHILNHWLNMAEGEGIEVILSLDSDDTDLNLYKELCFEIADRFIISENKNAVQAINVGAKFSKGEIIIVVSDDQDCINHWDTYLLQSLKQYGNDWIMKTEDGIQNWLITLPIMTRKYYERFNYIYHPSYEHCFCDTELTCVADMLGRKLVSIKLFQHNHHSIGRSKKDEVSKKADSTFESGKKNFIQRKAKLFDLVNPPCKMIDNVYSRIQ